MKYLSDYSEQPITDILNKYGAFYAFSKEQFNESRKEGVEYTNVGSGLLCPKEDAIELMKGMIAIAEASIAQDKQENGKVNIIRRELANHEAFYVGDIEDTADALKSYGYTNEEIWHEYYAMTRENKTSV